MIRNGPEQIEPTSQKRSNENKLVKFLKPNLNPDPTDKFGITTFLPIFIRKPKNSDLAAHPRDSQNGPTNTNLYYFETSIQEAE